MRRSADNLKWNRRRLKQFASAFATDHTVCESVIELERRPDGECKLAHPHPVTVTQLDDRQIFRIDLDDCDIGLLVRTHDPSREIPAVPQFHLDFVRTLDHMKVRENVAIWSNDKTGAFALDRSWRAWASPWIILVGRTLEEQVIERRAFGDIVFLRNLNNDNARRDGFEHFCKSVV